MLFEQLAHFCSVELLAVSAEGLEAADSRA